MPLHPRSATFRLHLLHELSRVREGPLTEAQALRPGKCWLGWSRNGRSRRPPSSQILTIALACPSKPSRSAHPNPRPRAPAREAPWCCCLCRPPPRAAVRSTCSAAAGACSQRPARRARRAHYGAPCIFRRSGLADADNAARYAGSSRRRLKQACRLPRVPHAHAPAAAATRRRFPSIWDVAAPSTPSFAALCAPIQCAGAAAAGQGTAETRPCGALPAAVRHRHLLHDALGPSPPPATAAVNDPSSQASNGTFINQVKSVARRVLECRCQPLCLAARTCGAGADRQLAASHRRPLRAPTAPSSAMQLVDQSECCVRGESRGRGAKLRPGDAARRTTPIAGSRAGGSGLPACRRRCAPPRRLQPPPPF